MTDLPIIDVDMTPKPSPREAAAAESGASAQDRGNTKAYPVPGQGIEKQAKGPANLLPVIEVQHLTAAPTLKSWLDTQEGELLIPEHGPIIEALKNARKNGAPINLNVNEDGKWDRAFSGANGNMVRIVDFARLLESGLPLGDCLLVTKLVCGPNGACGNPGPCAMCRDIRDGCYTGLAYVKEEDAAKTMLEPKDLLDEEINTLVQGDPNYAIHGDRIVNMENSKGANVDDVKKMCRAQTRGVIYILEMLGVYRLTEASSHNALKRGDLGGH